MDRQEAKQIIEAILFASNKPVASGAIKDILKDLSPEEVKACVDELNGEYSSSGRSFSIKEIAGGYQMLTDPVYSRWISALYKRPAEKLRGPALETLSIIAYKQPIARSQIEAIRGVNVDGVLQTLEERNLIRTRGRLEAPGRPILYGTTTDFLQHFGLKSLEDLPRLKEFQETDLDFIKEQERARIDKETGKLKARGIDVSFLESKEEQLHPDTGYGRPGAEPVAETSGDGAPSENSNITEEEKDGAQETA
jgi:segregation and condensation protein B